MGKAKAKDTKDNHTSTKRHTNKNIGQCSTSTNSRKCRGANKLTNYYGIGHIVYLLKKAAKDHRHRKNSQRFKGWICDQIFIFRHDYIPSKNRLSQILSQVKKLVQHSNDIFAICNSPLLH